MKKEIDAQARATGGHQKIGFVGFRVLFYFSWLILWCRCCEKRPRPPPTQTPVSHPSLDTRHLMRQARGGAVKIGLHLVHHHLLKLTCQSHLPPRQGVIRNLSQMFLAFTVKLAISRNLHFVCAIH